MGQRLASYHKHTKEFLRRGKGTETLYREIIMGSVFPKLQRKLNSGIKIERGWQKNKTKTTIRISQRARGGLEGGGQWLEPQMAQAALVFSPQSCQLVASFSEAWPLLRLPQQCVLLHLPCYSSYYPLAPTRYLR